MSSKSKPNSQPASDRRSLPFEPKKNRKGAETKAKQEPTQKAKPQPRQTAQGEDSTSTPTLDQTAIPTGVSRRMIRRMALLCGIPTACGIGTFFVSYFLITQAEMEIPNTVVVLISMAFFGFGVLGLSYGVLSASWDEERPGQLVGWSEFTTNVARLQSAWRAAGKKSS